MRRMIFALLLPIFLMMPHSSTGQVQQGTRSPRAEAKPVVAFVDVNVVPMDTERILAHQTVIVRGGRIAVVGAVSATRIPPGAKVVRGEGKQYLLPGLADMHTHADEEGEIPLYVLNGVTTMLNLGGASATFVTKTRKEINAGERIGPYAFVAYFMDGPGGTGGTPFSTPEEARAAVHGAKQQGYEFIKVYNSLSTETFMAIIDEARKKGLAVVGHGVRAPGLKASLEAGQVMIAHAEEVMYTHFQNGMDRALIPSAVELFHRTGAFLIPNLSAYEAIARQWGNREVLQGYLTEPEARFLRPERRGQWADSDYVKRDGSLGRRPRFLRELTKAMSDGGIPLMLGTDSPNIPGMFAGASIHDDLRTLIVAGLTPYQALSAGTRTAGEFIHKTVPGAEEFGTVAPGKRADLLLLAENPLESIENVRHPLGVMAHGRWLDHQEIHTLLEELAESFAKDSAAQTDFERAIHEAGVEHAVKNYRAARQTNPRWRRVGETYVNNLAYGLLFGKKFDDATQLFLLNVELYPQSANAYDSLAEAYMDAGKKPLASQNYQKSLELNPLNTNAVAMLKKLRGEQKAARE
jgi:imidazolonepropionase-like amidohydrolase